MKAKTIQTALIVLIAAILLGVFLSSCSTSKKFKTSVSKKSDSSYVNKSHSEGVKQVDSTGIKKEVKEYKNTIDIVFEDDTTGIDIISKDDPVEKATDLAGPVKKPAKKVHSVTLAGKTIESSRPIKSISINLQGKTTDIDITSVKTKDSGQVTTNNSGSVATEIKATTKEKESTRPAFLIWLSIAIGLTGVFVWSKYDFFPFTKLKRHAKVNKGSDNLPG